MCDRCSERIKKYQNKFYDFGFIVIDHDGRETWNKTEPDVIVHPRDHKSINIVGRDH